MRARDGAKSWRHQKDKLNETFSLDILVIDILVMTVLKNQKYNFCSRVQGLYLFSNCVLYSSLQTRSCNVANVSSKYWRS